MYIVTGAAGFIGSAFVAQLNASGVEDIIVVDEIGSSDRWLNLRALRFTDYIHKDRLLELIESDRLAVKPTAVVHMGACSATTERDVDYLLRNNYGYTVSLAEYALRRGARFIYASSAATYGDGAVGYSDADVCTPGLIPLNPYGYSKQLFDTAALKRGWLNKIAGLKFFNVYGPNEYHKGNMRSVVHQAHGQIRSRGSVRLFRSYRAEYADGEQKRDFIYVKDCVKVMNWLLENPSVNGLFNLGSGTARSWNDLAAAVFTALKLPPKIEYIEMPEELRGQYQYFTEAPMEKLRAAGYTAPFATLEEGVADYVNGYLEKSDPFLHG